MISSILFLGIIQAQQHIKTSYPDIYLEVMSSVEDIDGDGIDDSLIRGYDLYGDDSIADIITINTIVKYDIEKNIIHTKNIPSAFVWLKDGIPIGYQFDYDLDGIIDSTSGDIEFILAALKKLKCLRYEELKSTGE